MSNPILDRGAQLAAALRHQPQFAALEPVEHLAIGSALQDCPELDRATVGAAWMLLGDVLGQLADARGLTLQQAVAVAHLAGQRLYTETGREVHCTEVYSSGAPCKFGVKSLHESVLEATMRAHYATYHPAATWPPNVAGVDDAQETATVVHLPRLNEAGQPTDYALCDNGERDVAPGVLSYAGPGFGKSDPTCPTCIEIDENGEPDPAETEGV